MAVTQIAHQPANYEINTQSCLYKLSSVCLVTGWWIMLCILILLTTWLNYVFVVSCILVGFSWSIWDLTSFNIISFLKIHSKHFFKFNLWLEIKAVLLFWNNRSLTRPTIGRIPVIIIEHSTFWGFTKWHVLLSIFCDLPL